MVSIGGIAEVKRKSRGRAWKTFGNFMKDMSEPHLPFQEESNKGKKKDRQLLMCNLDISPQIEGENYKY